MPNLALTLVHNFIAIFHISNYLGSQWHNPLILQLGDSSDLTGCRWVGGQAKREQIKELGVILRYLEPIPLSPRQIADSNRKPTDLACPILSQKSIDITKRRESLTWCSAQVIDILFIQFNLNNNNKYIHVLQSRTGKNNRRIPIFGYFRVFKEYP